MPLSVCVHRTRVKRIQVPRPRGDKKRRDVRRAGLDVLLNTSSLTPPETGSSLDLQLRDQTKP